MEVLRTLITTVAGDSDEALLDNWAKGMPAEGIYLDMDLPVTVGGAGGTPGLADLKSALAYFVGVFSGAYGAAQQHKPYIGIDGGKLRNIHRTMTMTEVWNDFVGVAAQGAVGAHVWHARLFLTPNRQKADGPNRLIGWTQGASMKLANKEGAAFAGAVLVLSRTAAVNSVIRIVPAYRKGEDNFTHLPFYREVNRAALDVSGPDGKLLACWDDNAAFLATAIGRYSFRIGDMELYRLVEPKYAYYDYVRDLDAGGSDIADEVTQFYMADPFADENELPTGASYLKLVNQDVASLKARYVYLPTIDDAEASAIVAETAKARGEEVVATVSRPPEQDHQNGSAATAQIELVGAGHPRFGAQPGLHSDDKGNVQTFIPPGLVSRVAAAGADVKKQAQKVVSLRVPGSTTSRGRGRANAIRQYVRKTIGG